MKLLTFAEYIAVREGYLSASRPPLKGMAKINITPFTNARRKRMRVRAMSAPNYFAPTVRPVAQVVPPHLIPKL